MKYLLIGSPEAYSGKSALILGMAYQLQQKGIDILYGKPIGTCLSESQTDTLDEDVRFIAETLQLSAEKLLPTLVSLDELSISRRICGEDQTNYLQALEQYTRNHQADLTLLEGPGTLQEGQLFNLSLPTVAQSINASVLLVARFHSSLVVDKLLAAQQELGDRLIGVIINDVPPQSLQEVDTHIRTFLEGQGIPVLAILPRSDLLRSVSVRELVHQLQAEVLCRRDRLDLMVESLKIGAMNVNAALKYFRNSRNMAVVTGGDRTDIQLAALETSTNCLILTGQITPHREVLSRAEDLEIPILSVDLDTLTTVEIIDNAFGQVRFKEPVKVQHLFQMLDKHLDLERLLAKLNLKAIATT